nr:MAG TPA: large terminase [Caudoviricetes sp.]
MKTIQPKIRLKKTIQYNFSEKHKDYIRRCRECVYNIAEGAVRAGKTVDNVLAFCEELKHTPDKLHLATASTAPTAKLIIGDCNGFGIEHFFRGQCRWGQYKGNEALIICGKYTNYKTKIVMFVGGGKADSYKKFRGTSIGMWIATEIDLHHEETIKEALTRQAAAKNRKIFWDLNPGSPFAMIYKKYIDEYARKYANGELLGGYNYAHFTIYDNINITDEQREAFISQYDPQTVEYRRKIKGERSVAEGLVFQQFADNPQRFTVEKKYSSIKFISIGVDFGGNGSKTTFVASAILGNFQQLGVVADYKIQGGKRTIDTDLICRELMTFYKYVKAEYPNVRIPYIFCDCTEQTLITSILFYFRRNQIPIEIKDSYKGTINNRIFALNSLMTQGRFFVYKDCNNVKDSLSSQVWDTKDPTKDVRLDDGTYDIDTADALEYSFSSFIKYFNVMG